MPVYYCKLHYMWVHFNTKRCFDCNCSVILIVHCRLQVLPVDLVPEPTQHLRRTRRPLRVKQGEVSFGAGFQPICVVQLHPPAVPTAIAVGANWGM